MSEIPRGIRNNSPGNIRRVEGMHWLGECVNQTDPDFVQFSDPVYGLRAIVRIMRSYKRRGLSTIHEAICCWAPPSENQTEAYVSAVCKGCNVEADDRVDYDQIMPLLLRAIVLHENGVQPYSNDQIDKAITLARESS